MMVSVGFCDPVTDDKCKSNPDPVDNFDCPDAEGLGMIITSWILLFMYDNTSRAKKPFNDGKNKFYTN